MNHAALVGVFQRAANRHDVAELLREWQGGPAVDHLLEALALQILHGDVGRVAFLPELIHGDDVGVLQRPGRPGLLVEAR